MSVEATLAALKSRLATIDPTPEDPPTFIYENPAEAVSLLDMPVIVLAYHPLATHVMRRKAQGMARHDYNIAIYVLLGSRETGLPELERRALPWAQAIAKVLYEDQRLGGAVQFIGEGGAEGNLFTYQVGPIAWADGVYFGLLIDLPITEAYVQRMA